MGIFKRLASPFMHYQTPNQAAQQANVAKAFQTAQYQNIKKGYNGHDKSITEPLLPDAFTMGINPGYRAKPAGYGTGNTNNILRKYAVSPIFQAILNTRTSQVQRFTTPLSQSSDGMGFQITLANKNDKPTDYQQAQISRAEHFIQWMGVNDPSDPKYQKRDNFSSFCAKLVRDTYTYDQVNAEKTYDTNGKLHHLKAVDPVTICFQTDKHTNLVIPNHYVQVWDERIVNHFTDEDMIFAVRRPRTDIYSAGYGQSELEVALNEFLALQNTEMFNDRFFSHGGSVQGILNIKSSADKAGSGQSRRNLQDFRRSFERRVTGMVSSWQIPVVTAEDVQYVNLTPNARDMEFEKWLNFLINICASVFNIDPAEIGFPNRGGATGSRSNSLNEGNAKQKLQASMNKGLAGLLRFIEDFVNNEIIIPYFGSTYRFSFVGEDVQGDTERVKYYEELVKTVRTPNEMRKELYGLGPVPGGDIIMNQFAVQRYGQLLQEKQMERDNLQSKLQLLQSTAPQRGQDGANQLSFQDVQSGLNGKQSGKPDAAVKNGQASNGSRTDKINYGGKPDK